MKVAYQGIAGAYGEEALLACYGSGVARVPERSFDRVFEAVARSEVDAGVVPIENSLAGSILENYDLLLEHELQIVAETSIPVHHSLLVPDGHGFSSITHCYSHPQALAQCMPFLRAHEIEPRATYNTAVAARDLAVSAERGASAIASARAGDLYGLVAVASDIQTRRDNTTRFFAIAREHPAGHVASKASIVFTTVNEPGALLACLEVFSARSLNLTKLESRPTGETMWEYFFYVDFEAGGGELAEAEVEGLVADLHGRIDSVRILGRYARMTGTS